MLAVGKTLTVALRAWMVWCLGKPMEVRMAMLSSGGWLSNGEAVGRLGLGRSGSMYEGIARGSAKSAENATGLSKSHLSI